MKRFQKKLSLGIIMVFMLTLLLPVGVALAAGCEISTVVQPGVQPDPNNPQDLGWVKVTDIDSCDAVYVEIGLPEGVEWDTPMTAGTVGNYIYIKDENGIIIDDGVRIDSAEDGYTVYFDDPAMFVEDAYIKAVFNDIIVKNTAPNQICLDIVVKGVEDGLLVWTEYGECSSYSGLDIDIECDKPKSVNAGSNQLSGEIEFSEDSPGTFTAGDSFTLTLPDGCEWDDVQVENGKYGLEADASIAGDELHIDITNGSSSIRDSFTVQGKIMVLPSVPDGDIEVDVDGTMDRLDYEAGTLLIASKGTATVSIIARDTSEDIIYPASYDKEIDEIKMSTTGTFEVGSLIILTLSDDLRWYNDWCGGSGHLAIDGVDYIDYYDDNQSVWLQVSDSVDEIVFEGLLAAALPDATVGDVIVKVGGDYSGEVIVGQVVPAASVSAEVLNVMAGEMNQAAGEIKLKETSNDSFKPVAGGSWQLTLELPSACSFAAEPQAAVNGEAAAVEFYSDMIYTPFESGDNTLVIVFDSSDFNSNRCDEITLSGIEYDIDKRMPAGELTLDISGHMLNKLYLSGNILVEDLEKDYAESTVCSVINAMVERSGLMESNMTIGEYNMFIDGESLLMDVAPYIKNDRTYLPVRYVSYALGIIDNGIIWDESTQTVTLIKGDTTVQIQISSTEMTVNGETLVMDVAPEISSDRTMFPVRFIAEAFGADVGWNPVTRTVSLIM